MLTHATVNTEPAASGDPTPPVPASPEVRALSLGALMVNDQGPFAVISGKVRTIGDVVVPGWTVTAIDPQARQVVMTADDGRSVTLTQNR
ncbi:MAG TPA: hypothetical protein VFF65_04880 [Phycisphaerales bacterium]|nr:hypothetical protein [Phycisphaerales bacterium]